MPDYEIHKRIGFIVGMIIGIIFFFFISKNIPWNDWRLYLSIPIILFYSNLPDLDHHMGKLRKKLLTFIFAILILSSFIVFFVNIWAALLVLTLTGIGGLLILKVRHRGPLHTYWFVFFAALPLLYIHWLFFILGISCAASHIFIDRTFSRTKRKTKKIFGITETHNYIFKF